MTKYCKTDKIVSIGARRQIVSIGAWRQIEIEIEIEIYIGSLNKLVRKTGDNS